MLALHFFSHPKPWTSEFADIQTIAIKSWLSLPNSVVTLLGDDEGTASASKRLCVNHIAEVKKNHWGTPLVSDIFDIIRNALDITSTTTINIYINGDIVIGPDFAKTIEVIAAQMKSEWLAIGCRTDWLPPAQISEMSVESIIAQAKINGKNHGPGGIDYFIFPAVHNVFPFVYPFALGKFVWDQWLVGNAHRRGCPVIDCSNTIFAAHINAPWYIRGQPETNRQRVEDSEEAKQNRRFDYYQRTISDGRTHYTQLSGSEIQLRE